MPSGKDKKTKTSAGTMLKVREKIEVLDMTSISLARSVGSGKSTASLDVMLRTSSKNRLRQYMMCSDEQRLQMSWALR